MSCPCVKHSSALPSLFCSTSFSNGILIYTLTSLVTRLHWWKQDFGCPDQPALTGKDSHIPGCSNPNPDVQTWFMDHTRLRVGSQLNQSWQGSSSSRYFATSFQGNQRQKPVFSLHRAKLNSYGVKEITQMKKRTRKFKHLTLRSTFRQFRGIMT